MPRKRKEEKKETINFIPIPELENLNALEYITEDKTTTDGDWISTSEFPYMKFPFEKFNPAQSGMLKYVTTEDNLVITSPTASGKTTMIEMLAAYTFEKGGKAIYLSPLKSLSNEKLKDWEDIEHAFASKTIGILTGDFGKTAAQMTHLNKSDMLILTSEMLDSCTRLAKTSNEDYRWLFETKILIVDESHLLGEPGDRGHRLESAIIRFSKLCPDARIVLLTATMSNLPDMANWLTALTGKETILYESNYRPCTLEMHFVKYEPAGSINASAEQIIKFISQRHNDCSCLTFVGSKKQGDNYKKELNNLGIVSEFYKADLTLEERNSLYDRFNSREIQHLVATTALSWGVNTSARVVSIAHMTFGPFDIISSATIKQCAGRAGRPKYDTRGIVYILIPEKTWNRDYKRIVQKEAIKSQMIDSNVIAFHVLAEIMNKEISSPADLVEWYKKTLACYQTHPMELYEAKDIFDRLSKTGMITELTDGTFTITQIGIITAQFYLIPEDMAGWIKNFTNLFDILPDCQNAKEEDINIGRALAFVPAWKNKTYISAVEKDTAMQEFGIKATNGIEKIALCYYLCLNSDPFSEAMSRNPSARLFYMAVEALRRDVERIISALMLVDVRLHKWRQQDFWSMILNRFKYGVPRERLSLCSVEGIGGARSKELFEKGIRSINDIINNPFAVVDILGEKVASKIINNAKAEKLNALDW